MSEAGQQERRTAQRRRPRRRRPDRRTPQRPGRLGRQEVARRRALVPPLRYPDQLPVSQRREDIAAAIRDHQVVIVAGETGSGKTTQLPKICLELGRGVEGMIGHTQPRRIAARTVAERIAEELDRPLGETVGYQVRFTDHSSRDTLVKLMTDGILLAELQHDRLLSAYDTIIIDEAHERSLNVDFLLGYLKQLLPRRPDLKVVITSATIDPERFARHFVDAEGNAAPIIEVSGRTYPVEVRYRPLVEEPEDVDEEGELVVRDQTEAIVDAVRELVGEGPGDILVFLPGEREIRDTADVLAKVTTRPTDAFDVVPLYARLSSAEQHRVFEPHGRRRVVLATNVAETSLTVPGIRYVVDAGLARISRYSIRTKVQRLPIEPVSQASANQRSGRCGRVEAGVCIRLYSEEDYESRPEFTDPEILRTNLASVILQMTALGLGDVGRFPFVDPPDQRNVRAGVQLLEELGALASTGSSSDSGRLTKLGRQLVRLPVDPRLGRMVLEADRRGCLREVLVITAALSVQDPRERPSDQQAQADQKHARFTDPTSDFMAWLNLWRYLRSQQRELSSSAFRRMCRAEYLNYLRVREWQELESQLRRIAKQLELDVRRVSTGSASGKGSTDGEGEVDADGIHQSLLSGLLSHVGVRDVEGAASNPTAGSTGGPPQAGRYLGARNARFSIFPGSGLFRKQPQYVMAAELVETSKLWARVNAAIKPEWAEELGGHLVKRTYSEPHWSKRRAAVMAYERVTLYGVPLATQRLVSYGKVDPALSRELFIRHALVYGEWSTRQSFLAHNRALLDEVEELENRARRRDIVVDEHTLFDFYDARIGEDVVSGAHFDSWWKQARRQDPDLLTFDPAMLVNEAAAEVTEEDYPDTWHEDDLALPLSYEFSPGAASDGVTVDVPVATLNRVDPAPFTWQVPGFRGDLVVALIRSLPKALRVSFVPAPNVARDFLRSAAPGEESLLDALERFLRSRTGVVVPREAWDWSKIPGHLRPTFRVVGEDGAVVATGKDLEALKAPLRPKFAQAMAEAASSSGLDVGGQTRWTFGTLERTFTQTRAGHEVRGFPAVVDEGTTVGVRVLGSEEEQEACHRRGLRRLLMLTLPSPTKAVADSLSNADKLGLAGSPYPSVADLLEDCVAAAVDALIDRHGLVWDEQAFEALAGRVRADLTGTTRQVVQDVLRVLADWRDVDKLLSGSADLTMLPALTEMKAQVGRLVHRGFVPEVGAAQLSQLPRYLAAVRTRRERLPGGAARDRQLMDQVAALQEAYLHRVEALPEGRPPAAGLVRVRWMLEELRVSLWDQGRGTAYQVSATRIRKALDEL
ncbi:MAG: ATP-dependent helicase HrpA [Nocardioidaceae bacterium]|nr:ATP-dependent helicase HrpA [Nocardioidaceae bacterium]